MSYAPLEDSRLHRVVSGLYLGEWRSSVERVPEFVRQAEARSIVTILSHSEGWRERVAAAKIIYAYALADLAAPLIATFRRNPEVYTAKAFSSLLVGGVIPHHEALLAEMQSTCPENSYGRRLLEIINSAVGETRA